MTTKTKIDPSAIYQCKESYAGVGFGVAFGERLQGDHEQVQRFPDRFQPDGEILEPPDVNRQATPIVAKQYATYLEEERAKKRPMSTADVWELTLPIDLAEAEPGDVKRLGLTTLVIPVGTRVHAWSPLLAAGYADRFRRVES